MNLTVLGSGSKGNCYVLDDGKEILVLDCGVPVLEFKKAIKFQISRAVGAIVTHEHSDHAKYMSQFQSTGLRVFAPYVAAEKGEFQVKQIGSYKVQTFPLVHDVPCFGFLIEHPTDGRILYATDTEYIKYRFNDLRTIIVEANYDINLLDAELDDTPKRDHVLRGHMEIETTKRFLKTNCNEKTKNVILAHLSESNANADAFVKSVQPEVNATVWIARKGLKVSI